MNRQINIETINRVVERIGSALRPERIIVFGSCAKGSCNVDSDLDLLIVMESEAPAHFRAAAVRRLFNPAPCPMDILVYTPAEFQKWNVVVNHIAAEAAKHGKVVYERK